MLRVFLWEKFQRPKSAGSIVTPTQPQKPIE